jgi:hypothetical protein
MNKINHGLLEMSEDYRWLYEGRPFTGISVGETDLGHRIESAFVEGVEEGTCRITDSKGRLVEESYLVAGAYHGERRLYENGELIKIICYENGKIKE